MKPTIKVTRNVATALLLAVNFMTLPLARGAHAQISPAVAQDIAPLPEATIKALQEAISKQGIAVGVNGVMNDATRNAIRQYQSRHHLPVTGEADNATLDKLGVVNQSGIGPAPAATAAQTPSVRPGSTASPQMPMQSGPVASGMMGGPMMQGMMQGMMQTMQGMMGMMQGQMTLDQARSEPERQSDRSSSRMISGPMMRGTMQGPVQRGGMRGALGGTASGCAMTEGQEQPSVPAMMQMMQGMMQMMQMMQTQMMQSAQRP